MNFSDSDVREVISLHLEAIKVSLANMERKLDELVRVDRGLEERVRRIEIDGAQDRVKLSAIVGGISIVVSVLTAVICKYVGV